MSTPKFITDTLAALRHERGPLSARLDAIDLAIDNLSRAYGLNEKPTPKVLHVERRKYQRAAKPDAPVDLGAALRRDQLLEVIGKTPAGVTLPQLRKALPKIDGKARSNALYQLKAAGKIRRAGNMWVKAA